MNYSIFLQRLKHGEAADFDIQLPEELQAGAVIGSGADIQAVIESI